MTMRRNINATNAYAVGGKYSQAVEIAGSASTRTLYISGQVPLTPDNQVPADFESQCALVWANIGAQLNAAGMDLCHIVKVNTYLPDRTHSDASSRIRREVLGENKPALTVMICQMHDPAWLLEIEVVAVA
jgi:2-iminobutanoate/2-iminopropanoate deaminase